MGENIEDYTAKLSTVTLGLDKGISDALRIGVLGTVGKSDYTFNNNDSRKDYIYQGNLIGSYEKNGLLGTASAFYGKTNGDIKRTVAFTTLYSEQDGSLDTKYYGLDLGVQKRYEGATLNITPRLELNITQMSQDRIQESGTYGLDVDSVDSTSVEPGIGFRADKTIVTESGIKITPNARVMYYRELSSPYKDMNGRITSVSDDNFKINGYSVDKNRAELSIGLRVENDSLEVSAGMEFKFDDLGNEFVPFAAVGYRF